MTTNQELSKNRSRPFIKRVVAQKIALRTVKNKKRNKLGRLREIQRKEISRVT